MRRCLVIYSVVAWRILWAALLARAEPDFPATILLAAEEWQALWCAMHRLPTPTTTPTTLAQAVGWIAHLDGYLGRRGDGPPGATTLWRGLQHVAALTSMYTVFRPPATGHHSVGNG